MAETYIAKDGEMLDYICWRYYAPTYPNVMTPDRQTLALNTVLAANRGISRFLKLTAGTPVVLPDLPAPAVVPLLRLWG